MSTGSDQLDPDRLESADFPIVRRGFETDLVRSQMKIAAGEIRRLRDLVGQLEGEISALEGQISALEVRAPADLEAEAITEAIGEEAVRVLEAARSAAADRLARAEAEAAEIVAGAERAAGDLARAAEHSRELVLEQARADAEEIVEEGRNRGREMVAEAQTVRERMLRDLANKRQLHRAELERLRAGRDRLLESLVDAQHRLDESTTDLVNAVPEARAAAERAGLRVGSEPQLTIDQLEAEITTARLIDHPLVEGVPGPVIEDDHDAELYDVESEAIGGRGSAESEVADEVVPSAADGGEDAPEGDAADVDELFERLRSSREQAVADAELVLADADSDVDEGTAVDEGKAVDADSDVDEGTAVDADSDAVPAGDESDADVVLAEAETETALADTEETGDGVEEDDDPDSVARAEAVEEIERSLKRLVVDEQGDLLDGLRRDGADAIRAVLESGDAYTGVLAEPLRSLVLAVAGDDIEIGTADAESSVQTLLVEPVRTRLREALDDTDDPDELSTTVRAVYRDCRSRRVGEAATAAVDAVFERAIGARSSAPA